MKYHTCFLAFVIIHLWVNASSAQILNGPSPESEIDTTNYVLGTQTIGVKYQFTEKTTLVETAERILAMGSNLLKFAMSERYKGKLYGLPPRDDIQSLTDLAHKEPSMKAVLDMPFAYYLIWVNTFAPVRWQDGFSKAERDATYGEIKALATYLLTTYQGTGKTFLLGHWEGDWLLHQGTDRTKDPTPEAIKGMIDWLNVRQEAIDDAKREVPVDGISLYHYTEVNLVAKGMKGGKCLVNDVLPHTTLDYVSYSSYDTTKPNKDNVREALQKALDYIESKLPSKPGFQGKRVFIGEYGLPLAAAGTPEKQDEFARDVCLSAVEWGCPFVLYWELYCNEKINGKHRGVWLIDDTNLEQPFYHTLSNYYTGMKRAVAAFKVKHGRNPTNEELRKKAIAVLKSVSNEPSN
ncbi:MAG: hypothetical protein AAF984_00470 [Verrucomicrobiota bacterium]